MLEFVDKYPACNPKEGFTFLQENREKLAVIHSLEKPILLNFSLEKPI